MSEWRARFAGHLGVRSPNMPLFRHLAGSPDPVAQIELLAELGFAGVSDNFLCLRPPDEQHRIGRMLVSCGLEMGSFVHDPAGWNQPGWTRTDAAGPPHWMKRSRTAWRRQNGAAAEPSPASAAVPPASLWTINSGRWRTTSPGLPTGLARRYYASRRLIQRLRPGCSSSASLTRWRLSCGPAIRGVGSILTSGTWRC